MTIKRIIHRQSECFGISDKGDMALMLAIFYDKLKLRCWSSARGYQIMITREKKENSRKSPISIKFSGFLRENVFRRYFHVVVCCSGICIVILIESMTIRNMIWAVSNLPRRPIWLHLLFHSTCNFQNCQWKMCVAHNIFHHSQQLKMA